MSEETTIDVSPPPSLVNATHLVYALHALSLVIGITTAATIIGAFVFGLPSIAAVIISYLKRGEARGPSSNPTSAGRFALSGLASWPISPAGFSSSP